MANPPVVNVSYDPNANPSITVDVDPVNVPPGVFTLQWHRAPGSPATWSFKDIVFNPNTAMTNKKVNDHTMSVLDRNVLPNHGEIKYDITIHDSVSNKDVVLDPQIVNEEGGSQRRVPRPTK